MMIEEKERLARLGDMSIEACAYRLRAARRFTGMSQTDAAHQAQVANNALNNMEHARQFPNREVMRYYYRAHRIDFNFFIHGDFAQLPGDVQEKLMAALAAD